MRAGFRLMTPLDLPALLTWQSSPAAAPWFSAPTDLADAEARYGARLRGEHPTRMYVAQLADTELWRDVGYVQAYRLGTVPWVVSDHYPADAVGLDYLIGSPDLLGRGVGTVMLRAFLEDVIPADFPDASLIVSAPNHRNTASRRLLTRLGFTEGMWIDEPASPGRMAETVVVHTLRRRPLR